MGKLIKIKEVEDIEKIARHLTDWLVEVMYLGDMSDESDWEDLRTDIRLALEEAIENISVIGIDNVFNIKI